MIVRVKLFAGLRERAGVDEVEVELEPGATTDDLLTALGDLTDGVRCVVAVNREYSGPGAPIGPGDEVALVPPISGGAGPSVTVGPEPIDPSELMRLVGDPAAGAIVTFTGTTREVESLDYEAYLEMATERIGRICEEVAAGHSLTAIAAAHRTGTVALGEPSVVVAVSAPHRPEAFAGAREAIDRIKAEAPIWKVEVDGADRRRVEGTLPPVE
jgi:molybdopterin synthase catalytic subunit